MYMLIKMVNIVGLTILRSQNNIEIKEVPNDNNVEWFTFWILFLDIV